MKHEELSIREAVDTRLSGLDSDCARRERIRQRISQMDEPVIKKRLSAGALVAIVFVLVLTSVALAIGLNLFEYFGKQDRRLSNLAPNASLNDVSAANEIPSQATSSARINSSYYDGQSLLVGYILSNANESKPLIPSEELLSRMSQWDQTSFPMDSDEKGALLFSQYTKAVEQGRPFGIATYSVSPSDHTQTEDGIDLPALTEREEVTAEGLRYVIREYESPLPQAAQNQEVLHIEIPFYKSVSYLYFDGKQAFLLTENMEVGAMTAAIPRVEAGTMFFTGIGKYTDLPITAVVNVSAVSAHVTISAFDAHFPPPSNQDSWYNVILMDEKGNRFRTAECGLNDDGTITALCEGTGLLPTELSLYLLMCSEGEWDEAASLAKTEPVALKAIE